jgi:hypothetical protein
VMAEPTCPQCGRPCAAFEGSQWVCYGCRLLVEPEGARCLPRAHDWQALPGEQWRCRRCGVRVGLVVS